MARIEKDLKAYPVPTHCYRQDCPPPAQAAQGLIQPGLEHLRGWGIHSCSGQPVPGPHHTLKNFPLTPNLNLPFFNLKPFPLVLSLFTHVKS